MSSSFGFVIAAILGLLLAFGGSFGSLGGLFGL